jgi:peptide/nickel transport system permease protein
MADVTQKESREKGKKNITKDEYIDQQINQKRARRIKGFLHRQAKIIGRERSSRFAAYVLMLFVAVSVFAPYIAPRDPFEIQRSAGGDIQRLQPPSTDFWFGTTDMGRDIFSQIILGAQVSLTVGLVAALIAIVLGSTFGIVSAYYGGWIDDILMRITDIAYAMPFLPFIFLLVIFFGPDRFNIAIAISLLLWRSTARVVRSQTLSIKERPYIEAAKATGTNDFRIMRAHILPNVAPLIFLYGAIAIAVAILAEAGIAFLGMGDPQKISWGQMIYEVYQTGNIREAPWWVIAPGSVITLVVVSVFFVSRAYEQVANPDLEDRHQ